MSTRPPRVVALAELLLPDGEGEPTWVDLGAQRRSLADTAKHLERSFAQSGAAFVRVPLHQRSTARRAFMQAGLDVGPTLLYAPSAPHTRYLAVAQPAPVSLLFALGEAALGPVALAAARIARHPAASWTLSRIAPFAGFLVRPPNGRPLLHWLGRLLDDGDLSSEALVVGSTRGALGSTIVHAFSHGKRTAIAKVSPQRTDTPGGEVDGLMRVAESARQSGIRAPALLASARLGDRRVAVEAPVRGRVAAVIARGSPTRSKAIVETLAEWLLRWNRATRVKTADGGVWLRTEILAPAETFLATLPFGPVLRRRLADLAEELAGRPLPLCSSHGDLTLWNVLLDDAEPLGVVDWETARESDLAPGDFFYLATDASLLAGRAADRAGAMRACFGDDGSDSAWTKSIGARWLRELELPPAAIEAAFLGVWLRHARVERARGGSTQHEFLDVLGAVARDDAVGRWFRW